MADWKKIIGTIAPTLGTMLGGPLAGTAVAAVSNAMFGEDRPEQEVAQAVVNNMTPEKIAEIKRIDNEHAETMAKIGFDYAKLKHDETVAYIDDTADARKYKDDKSFWLGVAILITFALAMGASLWGSYRILNGELRLTDPSVMAAVSGFIGSIIGYISANAQQVVSYFFGSSAGSRAKTDALAESAKNLIK